MSKSDIAQECICTDSNQSVHSERCILGSILNGQITAHNTGLSADHFSEAIRREMFNLFLKIEDNGFQVDIATACDHCPDRADIVAALAQNSSVDSAITGQHIEVVKRAAKRRMLYKTFSNAANSLKDPFADDDGIAIEAITTAEEIVSKSSSSNAIDAKALFNEVLAEISSGEPPKAITTGFSAIDSCLSGGFHDGELVTIGAGTGVGKSVIMLNMALSALSQGKKVAFFSIEMSKKLIEHRKMANISGVPMGRITRNAISAADRNKIEASHARIPFDNWHLFAGVNSLETIQSEIMRLKDTAGLDIAFIDYLQIVVPGQKSENRTVEVGKVSKALKQLAMKADIPIITASQIKRLSQAEKDRPPVLSDLRESGSIEQDSDVVMFLHAETDGNSNLSPERDLNIAKNRQGELGHVRLHFDGSTMYFRQIQQPRKERRGFTSVPNVITPFG